MNLTKAIRLAFARKPFLSTADWSEAYRFVTQGPCVPQGAKGVRWSNQTFPIQKAIMDAIDDPSWSRVVVVAPPQTGGKTDCAAINPILKALHYDRRDCLYVSASANKAYDQWHKKFKPALAANNRLSELIDVDREQGGTRERRDFANGASLFLAGAESVSNLSGSTIPVIVCDDVQAMPANIATLGHPVEVAIRRGQALPEEMRTVVILGTAGSGEGYLWLSLKKSTWFKPYIPCLRCGQYQRLDWSRAVISENGKGPKLTINCVRPECGHSITQTEVSDSLMLMKWVGEGQEISRDGNVHGDLATTSVAGFWWNALYWPYVSWATHAREYQDGRGNPDKERSFCQDILCQPYEPPDEDENAITVAQLAEHEIGYSRGQAPSGVEVVTLTVDVHDRFLYYVVRGWNKETGESWLIDAGTKGVHGPKDGEAMVPRRKEAEVGFAIRRALEDVWDMERKGWPSGGSMVHAEVVLTDGGYRPDAVNTFCLKANLSSPLRKWHMVRGESTTRAIKPIWPRIPIVTKKGHVYRAINVDEAKHRLRELLAIPAGRPGAWYTYSDISLEAYHRHLVSEHFVEVKSARKIVKAWVKREGAGPNHWLDCETYQIAAAIAAGVLLLGDRGRASTPVDLSEVMRG